MSRFYDRVCNIITRILERVLTPVTVDTSSAAVQQRPLPEEQQNSTAMGDGDPSFAESEIGNARASVDRGLGDVSDWPGSLDWNQESWMEVLEGSNFPFEPHPCLSPSPKPQLQNSNTSIAAIDQYQASSHPHFPLPSFDTSKPL